MKKFILAFFVIVTAVLAFFYFSKKTSEDSGTAVQINTGTVEDSHKDSDDSESVTSIEENTPVSFIALRPDEILLSSMGVNLDDDHADDEIIVVKKGTRPNLYLVIGIYNSRTSVYDRVAEIETKVTQFRSFSYNVMDVTGEHKTSIIYQGFTENGDSVMQIFLCRTSGGNFAMDRIGDFRSDGTIFIQQHTRTDTYELSQSIGRSFPVWVYSSDTREGAGNLSQVQTEYDWDPAAKKYVQIRQIYVTGKNLAAKELARIQDGTVKTFANYLNGLWYKTSNSTNEVRYIFFDYENSEVNFLVNDTQEVYTWLESNLYRNGIYLSAVNNSIENLRRRFDITLTDLDEMRVRVYDDVRMRIGADALWDGQYRKLNVRKAFLSQEEDTGVKDLVARLEGCSQWYMPDGTGFTFKNGRYTVNSETLNESGVYFASKIGNEYVLQFNTAQQARYLDDAYILRYAKIEQEIDTDRKKKTVYVDDPDKVILYPAVIMASECYEASDRPLHLSAASD